MRDEINSLPLLRRWAKEQYEILLSWHSLGEELGAHRCRLLAGERIMDDNSDWISQHSTWLPRHVFVLISSHSQHAERISLSKEKLNRVVLRMQQQQSGWLAIVWGFIGFLSEEMRFVIAQASTHSASSQWWNRWSHFLLKLQFLHSSQACSFRINLNMLFTFFSFHFALARSRRTHQFSWCWRTHGKWVQTWKSFRVSVTFTMVSRWSYLHFPFSNFILIR